MWCAASRKLISHKPPLFGLLFSALPLGLTSKVRPVSLVSQWNLNWSRNSHSLSLHANKLRPEGEENKFFVHRFIKPPCLLCPQELYSGGKDCNILAWVPVLRPPDVEDEGKKVGRHTDERPNPFLDKETLGVSQMFVPSSTCSA